jgi:TRAP-type transport system periplasmic protein
MIRKLLSLVIAAGIAIAPLAASAQTAVLRLGHVTQTSHPFHMGAEMFKKGVAEKTNGQVDIQIFPARQLGDDRQLLEGVRLGTIDAAVVSSSTFSLFTPVMDALQLPWLIRSYEQLADGLTSPPAKKMLDSLDSLGLKGLGFYEGGFRHFVNRVRPVRTAADLEGLKIRVVPNTLHIAIFKAAGTNPTPMPYGEIYTGLQTGVIDGAEMNISSIFSERFYESAKHVSLTGQFFFPAVVIVNKARFERLTPAQRTALQEAAQQTIRAQVLATGQQEKEVAAQIKAKGVEILPFGDMETVQRKTKAVSDEYESKHPLIKEFAEYMRRQPR